MDPNDQPRTGSFATTTHDLNRQIVVELISNYRRIYQRAVAEKLSIGLASVNEIIAGLGFARPHTSAATSAAIANFPCEVVPHPPYKPDLAPPDFRFLSGLKERLIISKYFISHVVNFKLLRKMVSRRF